MSLTQSVSQSVSQRVRDTHGIHNKRRSLLQELHHGLGQPRGGGLSEPLGQLGVPAGDHGGAGWLALTNNLQQETDISRQSGSEAVISGCAEWQGEV